MNRRWVSWPMAVAVLVTILNVELVLIPTLVAAGVCGFTLFAYTAAAASIEVSYWYWFAGWLQRQAPFISVVQSTVRDFHNRGLLGQVRDQIEWGAVLASQVWGWFVGHVRAQMEVSNLISRWLLARALGIIRTSPSWMMYPIMIGLGLCPLGWIPGIFICRKHHVRGAFATLLVFNAIKTYGIGLGWTEVLEHLHAVLRMA